jgi:hypothetical protein
MSVYQSFSYSPTELAAQMTGATHDTLAYLWKNKYITTEQYNELTGKLMVMAVPNNKSFGRKLLEYFFGDNKEENSWVFPIVEVATHYKSATPEKPKNVTKLKAKPKLEVVKDE